MNIHINEITYQYWYTYQKKEPIWYVLLIIRSCRNCKLKAGCVCLSYFTTYANVPPLIKLHVSLTISLFVLLFSNKNWPGETTGLMVGLSASLRDTNIPVTYLCRPWSSPPHRTPVWNLSLEAACVCLSSSGKSLGSCAMECLGRIPILPLCREDHSHKTVCTQHEHVAQHSMETHVHLSGASTPCTGHNTSAIQKQKISDEMADVLISEVWTVSHWSLAVSPSVSDV